MDSLELINAADNNDIDKVSAILNDFSILRYFNTVDINYKHPETGRTALITASNKGYIDIIKLLLDNNADTNLQDIFGKTALLYAVSYGYNKIVDLLINKKANVNIKDNDGCTALICASREGHDSIVNKLIEYVDDINACDTHKRTAIMYAASNSHEHVINSLIDNNVDLNLCDINNDTALILSVSNGHINIVNLLLDNDVYINSCNNDERTALSIASELGHYEIVHILLTYHADSTITDTNSLLPVDYAVNSNHKTVVEILLDITYFEPADHMFILKNACRLKYSKQADKAIITLLENSKDLTTLTDVCNILQLYYDENLIALCAMDNVLTYETILNIVISTGKSFTPLSCNSNYILQDIVVSEELPIKTKLGLWNQLLDSSITKDYLPIDKRIEILVSILDSHSLKYCYDLISLYNYDGSRVIDTTSYNMKTIIYKYIYINSKYDIISNHPIYQSNSCILVHANDYSIIHKYYQAFNQINESKSLNALFESFAKLSKELDVHVDVNSLNFNFDLNNFNSEVFISYCIKLFGISRRVTIKFLINQNDFENEIRIRNILYSNDDTSRYVVPLYESIIVESENYKSIYKHITNYGVVTPYIDRPLDSIWKYERPNISTVKEHIRQICLCIKSLHSCNVVYNNITMDNICLYQNTLKLFDFTKSTKVNDFMTNVNIKTSILPPEMFDKLDADGLLVYNNYWNNDIDNIKYTNKIQPRVINNEYYIVKYSKSENLSNLPYDLIRPSILTDIWSLGILIYQLLTNQSFLPIDCLNDYIPTSYSVMYNLTDGKIDKTFRNVYDESANELLKHLLRVNPLDRYQCVDDILQSNYLTFATNISIVNMDIDKRIADVDNIDNELHDNTTNETTGRDGSIYSTKKSFIFRKSENIPLIKLLKSLNKEITIRCKQIDDILLRRLYRPNLAIPTCFILVNDQITFHEGSSVNRSSNPSKEYFDNLYNIYSDTYNKNPIRCEYFNNQMFIYFIDELTMEPLDNPSIITNPLDFIIKYMPLIRLNYLAISTIVGVNGLCNLLGYASLTNESNYMAINKFLNINSYINEFFVLQDILINANTYLYKSLESIGFPVIDDFNQYVNDNDIYRKDLIQYQLVEGMICWSRCNLLQDNINILSNQSINNQSYEFKSLSKDLTVNPIHSDTNMSSKKLISGNEVSYIDQSTSQLVTNASSNDNRNSIKSNKPKNTKCCLIT